MNVKRVYRVMRVHDLLLQRKPKRPTIVRWHDGRVAVAKSNQRRRSSGFEFRCENGEPLRVTFSLDCCDRRDELGSIGLTPLTTPVCSPQSNGMAESFVKTMKRDYVAFVPKP